MARTARVPRELTKAPFTLREALTAGLTKSALKGKAWRRIGTELYCWSSLREDPVDVLAAWHRRLPRDAVFSGLTAAWLHHLDVDPLRPIEIAVPADRGLRSRPGLIVHRLTLRQSEITLARGIRATTIPRTFADLRRRLPFVELLVLADEALLRRLGRFDDLAAPAESPMETRLRWLLIHCGLPRPEVQTDLYDDAGRFIGRADLFYSAARLVIEFDGGNHRDRLIADNRRQNSLIAAGFRVLRFTSADVRERPDAVVAQVRGAVAA